MCWLALSCRGWSTLGPLDLPVHVSDLSVEIQNKLNPINQAED